MIRPTVYHDTRISSQTALLQQPVARHATCCSNSRVTHEPCRAHGTRATTTPWRRQDTRGASASTNAFVAPRSSARHRRLPSPRSYPDARRPHTPQRDGSRNLGRTRTTTASSSTTTPSTTARPTPTNRANTLPLRTPPPAFLEHQPLTAGTLEAERRPPPYPPTDPLGPPQMARSTGPATRTPPTIRPSTWCTSVRARRLSRVCRRRSVSPWRVTVTYRTWTGLAGRWHLRKPRDSRRCGVSAGLRIRTVHPISSA